MMPPLVALAALVALACAASACSAPASDAKSTRSGDAKSKQRAQTEDDDEQDAKVEEETVLEQKGTTEAQPPAATECHAEALPATAVSSDYDGTFPTPLGAGGTLEDGIYTIVAWSKFKGHSNAKVEQRREKLVVSGEGKRAERVRQTNGGAVERTSYSIAPNGMTARLVFTQTCPAGATALSYSYRAIGNELTLYDTTANEGYDFER
jgi:hypothetical protein